MNGIKEMEGEDEKKIIIANVANIRIIWSADYTAKCRINCVLVI